MKRYYLVIFSLFAIGAQAQSLTDGLLMPKGAFCTGFLYTNDQWKDYWEGSLKRDNANIGTVTTQWMTYMGNYGVTDKLNIIAMLPYVKNNLSQGTLTGYEGLQDISLSAKYRFFAKNFTASGLRFFGVGTFSTPVQNYVIDALPAALGMGSTNFTTRVTGNYHLENGWYINVTNGFTFRSNVKLDRPSYFTDDRQFNTNEVLMHNVYDVMAMVGYYKNGIQAEGFYSRQNTLGGSDIRRQDMPFVSNRMNFEKAGALVMYYLPKPKGLALRASYSYTIDGRNVGQSSTFMGGILYTFHFIKNEQIIPQP